MERKFSGQSIWAQRSQPRPLKLHSHTALIFMITESTLSPQMKLLSTTNFCSVYSWGGLLNRNRLRGHTFTDRIRQQTLINGCMATIDSLMAEEPCRHGQRCGVCLCFSLIAEIWTYLCFHHDRASPPMEFISVVCLLLNPRDGDISLESCTATLTRRHHEKHW